MFWNIHCIPLSGTVITPLVIVTVIWLDVEPPLKVIVVVSPTAEAETTPERSHPVYGG